MSGKMYYTIFSYKWNGTLSMAIGQYLLGQDEKKPFFSKILLRPVLASLRFSLNNFLNLYFFTVFPLHFGI